MSKSEFLEQLNHKLRVLPESERADALEYYDGYISDAEDEQAISKLGTPGEVAAIILANYVSGEGLRGSGEQGVSASPGQASEGGVGRTSPFAGMKTAWVIILAIFAVPLGAPLAIVLIAVAFSLFIALSAVIFAFAVSGFATIFAGAVSILAFPFIAFQDIGFAILSLGNGLVSLGVGILLIKLTAFAMRGFPAISRFVGKKLARRDKNGKQ